MAVTTTKTNKPINPRGNDQSPKGYNRAALYSGKALDFDGVNDQINITTNDLDFGANDFSVSAIVNWTGSYADGKLAYAEKNASGSQLASWQIRTDPNGSMLFQANIDGSGWVAVTYNGVLDILAKGLTHLTFVRVGTGATLYINGEFHSNGIGSIGATLDTPNGDFCIGNRIGANNYWNGLITQYKVYSTALTAAQVSDLYNNPEKVVPTGVEDTALKLWLPMMEGAGTTAYDGSGNGNHGTISGATYVNGVGSPVAQSAVIDWNKSHNYIDKSEEFETASWTENRLVTITDDSFIAPDGSATATEIVENTANDTHFLAQTLSVTAGDYFISVYAKKRDYDFIQISTGGDTSRYANFNISTGATGNANGITDLIIEDAGNGWYRIGGKITTSATSFNYFVTLIQSDVASRFQTYTGTDKGQYIWGAQATKSSTLQPYLRNIGTSAITSDVLLPQGLTSGRDITGVNLFENVRKQGALNLDGNSWAEVHDNASLDITDAITLEAWYYHTGSGVKIIQGRWSNQVNFSYLMYVDGNKIKFVGSDGSSTFGGNGSTTNLNLDQFNHVVMTYDRTNLKYYLNGVLIDTFAYTVSLNPNASVVLDIGRNDGRSGVYTGSNYNNTPIAQPRIYNRALTAEEVLQNYNSGKSIYQ